MDLPWSWWHLGFGPHIEITRWRSDWEGFWLGNSKEGAREFTIHEVRVWRWIRTRSVARSQVPLRRSPPTWARCSHFPPAPAWPSSWLGPECGPTLGGRMWGASCLGQTFGSKSCPSLCFLPCLFLASLSSSLTPHCSQYLVLEFPNPNWTLMFRHGFLVPASCNLPARPYHLQQQLRPYPRACTQDKGLGILEEKGNGVMAVTEVIFEKEITPSFIPPK